MIELLKGKIASKAGVTVLILLQLLLFCLLCFICIPKGKPPLTKAYIYQDKESISVRFSSSGDNSVIVSGMGRTLEVKRGSSLIKIEPKEFPGIYTVLTSGRDTGVKPVRVEKVTQKVEAPEKIELIKGDTKGINVKAEGEVEISTGEGIEETGLSLKGTKVGSSSIRVTAGEKGPYEETHIDIPVTIYPRKLKTPKLKIKEKEDVVLIKAGKVPYMENFALYKVSSKEEKIEEGKSSFTIPRNKGTYRVKAVRKVDGEVIESDLSKPIEIKSPVESAKGRSGIHVIDTLTEEKLESVATLDEHPGLVPQSFSYGDKGYHVTYVKRKGQGGYVTSYNEKGEVTGERKVSFGKANGSTYRKGSIYIVKTSTNAVRVDEDVSSIHIPRVTSGIAYDDTNDLFYLSGGPKVLITNSSFSSVKTIMKKRHARAQDIGAFEGSILVAEWSGGKGSYVDIYRTSDGKYIGTYVVPLGEIESVTSVNGRLVILMHNTVFRGVRSGHILITKERIRFD